jgi:hypothetical protein
MEHIPHLLKFQIVRSGFFLSVYLSMATLASFLVIGLLCLLVTAYNKYRNDNFNPYK